MKAKKTLAFFLLVLVIFGLGCVDFDLFKEQIKGLSINENTRKQTSDVIVIEDIKTLPVSPVFSGQDFRLYFKIKNTDPERTVTGVHVELYDPSLFGGNYDASACSGECSLAPLSEKTVFFDLTAPTNDQIVNIQSQKRISFKVSYDYETTTIYDIVVVNKEEVERQQQAGKTVNIAPNKILGSGPVKIIPDLMGDYFLLDGVTGTVRFILQNEGTGMLKDNQVEVDDFNVEFPGGFSPTGYAIGGNLFGKIGDFFNPSSAITGNFLWNNAESKKSKATGMATSCNEFCGAEPSAPIVNGVCANGCSCYFSSECSSSYCMQPSGSEYGGTCQLPGTQPTTTIPTTTTSSCPSHCDSTPDLTGCRSFADCGVGCGCNCHSECTTNYCEMTEYGGTCRQKSGGTVTTNCPCSGKYGQVTRSCPDGCTCYHNSDCKSGYCDSPTPDSGGLCYTSGSGTTVPSRPTTTRIPIWERVQPTQFFSCSGDSCSNNIELQLFNSKSSPLTFALTGSTDADVYRIYTIKATAKYTYEIRKYVDVTVKPMGLSENAQPGEIEQVAYTPTTRRTTTTRRYGGTTTSTTVCQKNKKLDLGSSCHCSSECASGICWASGSPSAYICHSSCADCYDESVPGKIYTYSHEPDNCCFRCTSSPQDPDDDGNTDYYQCYLSTS